VFVTGLLTAFALIESYSGKGTFKNEYYKQENFNDLWTTIQKILDEHELFDKEDDEEKK